MSADNDTVVQDAGAFGTGGVQEKVETKGYCSCTSVRNFGQ